MKYVSIILGVTQITIPLNHHVLQVYKQNSLNNFECVLLKKQQQNTKKNKCIYIYMKPRSDLIPPLFHGMLLI